MCRIAARRRNVNHAPRTPNGEAQPPAEGDGALKRYGDEHKLIFKNAAIQPVGWSAVLAAKDRPPFS